MDAMCTEGVSFEAIKNRTCGYNGPRSMDAVKHCATILGVDYHVLLKPTGVGDKASDDENKIIDRSVCNMFYWNEDKEDVLARLSKSYNAVLAGTDYYTKRDDTPGEKCVELYQKGNPHRIGHFWPKVKDSRKSVKETIDFCIHLDLFDYLKTKTELPTDSDVKPGRYLKWRELSGITYEKSLELMILIANRE